MSSVRATGAGYHVPFTEVVLLTIVAAKPIWDGLYWFSPAKWLYHFLLLFFGFVCLAGARINQDFLQPDRRQTTAATWGLAICIVYAAYMALLYAAHGRERGTTEILFKVLDPFLVFWLIYYLPKANLRYAAVAYACIVIFGNALLFPTNMGWADWGDARTFKGAYFFKTDLAFSVVTSLLMLMMIARDRVNPLIALALVVGGVEVLLSNARMNYLLFGIVVLLIVRESRLALRTLAPLGISFAILGALVYWQYSSSHVLGFDFSDPAAFTQGRTKTWEIDIQEGLMKFSPLEWLVGNGLNYDNEVVAHHAGLQERFDSHNETLHTLLTQGIAGFILYLGAWWGIYRCAIGWTTNSILRRRARVSIVILVLQSLTASISLSTVKTWPIILVLLLMMGESERERAEA